MNFFGTPFHQKLPLRSSLKSGGQSHNNSSIDPLAALSFFSQAIS